jgi:hypothetical protein
MSKAYKGETEYELQRKQQQQRVSQSLRYQSK